MPGTKHSSAIYRHAGYFAAETTPGTPVLYYPQGTEAALLLSLTVTPSRATYRRGDTTGTPYAQHGGDEKGGIVFSAESHILPAGSGTAPDIEVPLLNVFTVTTSSADLVEAGSTSSSLNLTGHAYSVGEIIVVQTPSGQPHMARITVSNTNDITISPAAPAAPSTGAAVTAVRKYEPDLTVDGSQKAFTLYAPDNRISDEIWGAFVTSLTFTLGGEGAASLALEGTGRKWRRFTSTALDGAITDVATSATIHNADATPSEWGMLPTALAPIFAQIDDEVVSITGGGGTTGLTITRGEISTSNVAHDDDDEVEPYRPALTVAGSTVPGTGGYFYLDGTRYDVESMTLTLPSGKEAVSPHFGDPWSVNGYAFAPQGMVPTLVIEASTDAGADVAGKGAAYVEAEALQSGRSSREVFVYAGTAAGSMFGFRIPAGRIISAERGGDGDSEIRLTLTVEGYTDTSDTTPIEVYFG